MGVELFNLDKSKMNLLNILYYIYIYIFMYLDQRLDLIVGQFLLLTRFQKFSECRQGDYLGFRGINAGTIINDTGCSHRVKNLLLLKVAAGFVLTTVYGIIPR